MKLSECQKIKHIISESLHKGANEYKCDSNWCSIIAEDKDEFIFNECKLYCTYTLLQKKYNKAPLRLACVPRV